MDQNETKIVNDKKPKIKKPKVKKEKKHHSSTVKNFVKEVKRIKWPHAKKVWKWFGITIAFVVAAAIFCFLVTLGFTTLLNGVGITS